MHFSENKSDEASDRQSHIYNDSAEEKKNCAKAGEENKNPQVVVHCANDAGIYARLSRVSAEERLPTLSYEKVLDRHATYNTESYKLVGHKWKPEAGEHPL